MSGPQCCENPPLLSSSSGAGHIEQLGGLSTYISGSLDSKRAILLISDVFGYEAPNLRKLADKVGESGFYVVVPDFFHGDPYVPENAEKPILIWLKDHGTDKGAQEAKPVIEALRSKGVSAIGAAGFCWGEIKVPISILGAEVDQMSPPELLKQFEVVLSTKPEVNGSVKIFPGVTHGWTVRYDIEDEAAVKPAEEAHSDMLEWFVKYVK